jgi:hypothetical protein
MPIDVMALNSNRLMGCPIITHHCYQMVTIATDENLISTEPIAIEGQSSDHQGDTVETYYKMSIATVGPRLYRYRYML